MRKKRKKNKHLNLKAWFKFSILFKYLAIYLKSYYTEITQLNHALSLGQKTTPLFVIKILEFFWKVIKVIFPVKLKKVLNELLTLFWILYLYLAILIVFCFTSLWYEVISQNCYKRNCFQKTFVYSLFYVCFFLFAVMENIFLDFFTYYHSLRSPQVKGN